jgi:type VI secretion system protein ImpA
MGEFFLAFSRFVEGSLKHLRLPPDDLMRRAISQEAPTGIDSRTIEGGQNSYRALRDARSLARREERRREVADPGQQSLDLGPEWTVVRDLARKILCEESKDTEVLVWLTEAETRIDGHAGLARSLGLIADLVRDYGAALHPMPESAEDDPFAAIAGLNGVGREGALIQPLRLLSLVPTASYGHLTLWDVESGGAADKVQQAISEAGEVAMRTHHSLVLAALAATRDCDKVLSDFAGPKAPPFTQIIDVLDDTERTIRRLARLDIDLMVTADVAKDVETVALPDAKAAAPHQISSREQAFADLLRIAAYFRKAEPHSPISHSIETLVRRGQMDFLALLEELIPDDSTRRAVMTTAGIRDAQKPEEGDP